MPIGSGRKGVCAISSQNQRTSACNCGRGTCGIGVTVDREVCDRYRTVYAEGARQQRAADGSVFRRADRFIAIGKTIGDGGDSDVQRRGIDTDRVGNRIADLRHSAMPIGGWRKGVGTVSSQNQRTNACNCGRRA